MILLIRASRHARLFLAAVEDMFAAAFPVGGRRALELLDAGVDPGGSSIIVL